MLWERPEPTIIRRHGSMVKVTEGGEIRRGRTVASREPRGSVPRAGSRLTARKWGACGYVNETGFFGRKAVGIDRGGVTWGDYIQAGPTTDPEFV